MTGDNRLKLPSVRVSSVERLLRNQEHTQSLRSIRWAPHVLQMTLTEHGGCVQCPLNSKRDLFGTELIPPLGKDFLKFIF